MNTKEVMRLTSRGRLGINTTTPSELLDVNGNIKTSGNIISLGNVGIGTNNPVTTFDCRGTGYFQTVVIADIANIGNINNYQLRLNPPTSTNQYSSIQSTYVSSPTTYMPLVLNYNGGNVGIGSQYPNKNLEIYNTSPAISIKGSSEADTAILYLATPYTTASAYKCAIIAKGTSGWSRSYLHFCLNNIADNTYPAQNAGLNNIRMTIRPDGNINFYPEPFYINNTNGANYSVNLNVACNTTYTPATAAFLTATVADGWNSLDTIITLACSSRANSGYYNESRMILDGSYNTNFGRGTRGS